MSENDAASGGHSKVKSTVADLRGMTHHDVLIRPLITEKTMSGAGGNRYTFQVHPEANKIQIRQAVEKLFGVKVLKITTGKNPGKLRRRGRNIGYSQTRKKATVTLREGDQIEIGGTPLFEV
jgi:large subunit ribosomal protein L23